MSSTADLFKRAEAEGWASWIKTRADEECVAQGGYFDRAAGERVVQFIQRFLWQTKNVDKPRRVRLYDWQANDIILPLFSWKNANHLRRFRQGFIEIPKKNGKSFLASAIVLYLLMADNEHRAEVYSMAYDKKNARTVFDECRINAEGSPELNPLLTVTSYRRRIDYALTNSFYEVLSADQGQRNEGFDISGLVIDELHTLRKPELFEALRYGGATRRQPLSVYITTAGNEKNSVAFDLHEHALAILQGYRTNIDFFPYVRSAEGLDFTTEAAWQTANPMLGLTMPVEVFRREYEEAAAIPSRLAAFKRYRLNIWPDKSADAWLPMKAWNKCGETKYKAEDLEGQRCFLTVDIGFTDDLFTVLLLFPQSDGTFKVLPHFYCSRENAKQKNKYDPYLLWAEQGHITIVEEGAVSFERVKADIVELSKKYNIEKIGVDPWQARDLKTMLEADGFVVQDCGQTFKHMTAPCRQLEELVVNGQLQHGGNPVLDWMAGNATLMTDNSGSMRVKKPTQKSRKKCDGIVALLMSLAIAKAEEQAPLRIEIIR